MGEVLVTASMADCLGSGLPMLDLLRGGMPYAGRATASSVRRRKRSGLRSLSPVKSELMVPDSHCLSMAKRVLRGTRDGIPDPCSLASERCKNSSYIFSSSANKPSIVLSEKTPQLHSLSIPNSLIRLVILRSVKTKWATGTADAR